MPCHFKSPTCFRRKTYLLSQMGQIFHPQPHHGTVIVKNTRNCEWRRFCWRKVRLRRNFNPVMANGVKSKFAGLLRDLLRQLDDSARPDAVEQRPVNFSAGAPAPIPAPAGTGMKSNPFSPPRPANDNEVEIPIAPVIAALPTDLRGRLISEPSPEVTMVVPVPLVMSQLAFGAVKISFGELRQMAPGLFANAACEMDNRPVSLPLKEILTRLNPALLARRYAEKVEVAQEISGPFNTRGQGITFTTQPLKAPTAAPASSPAPLREPEPFKPIAFTPPPTPPPVVSPAGKENSQAAPLTMSRPAVAAPTPPAPAPKISVAPMPAPVVVVPPRAEPVPPTIFASLCDLSEKWPEEIKNEIHRSSLANASAPLAGADIEAGLKRGRVTMTWKQLRTLTQPSSPASPNDNLELELPLKVIAPLYLAAQKNRLQSAPKPAVSADIPDLFFGFPQPVSAPSPAKPADTNFYSRSDAAETPPLATREVTPPDSSPSNFTTRQAPPHDVVTRAVTLPGVAGALVALPDGLRVASKVPVELNADTLAAFLPQIFERVNQSTRELRMGALNNVSFTVGNVPWKIFRVNSVYFAAFGRAGEGLPGAELAQLAAELDRKRTK